MEYKKKVFTFSKKFIKKRGLKIIESNNSKKFIFDPENFFTWEIKKEKIFSLSAENLSLLPYKKKYFKTPYKDFDSDFFNRTSIILNISHKCNMSCVYCCAAGGSYKCNEELMTLQTAINAIEALAKTTRLTVVFFGGEPMLNSSVLLKTAKYVLGKAKSNKIDATFNLNTNGTISFKKFPELYEFIKDHRFEVLVSIDGPPKTQNSNRPLKNKQKSFDTVYANLKELVNLIGPKRVTAKVTMKNDVDDIAKLIEPILQAGIIKALVTPIVNSTTYREDEPNFTANDYRLFLKRDTKFLDWYTKEINKNPSLKIQPYHKLLSILYHSQSIAQFCLAGVKLFCVYPNGDVFPCHRFSGEKDILLGNINCPSQSIKSFKELMMQGKNEKCEKCHVRHICWGNKCLQQNKIRNQKLFGINDPLFCEYHKENLKLLLHSLSLIRNKSREESLCYIR